MYNSTCRVHHNSYMYTKKNLACASSGSVAIDAFFKIYAQTMWVFPSPVIFNWSGMKGLPQ